MVHGESPFPPHFSVRGGGIQKGRKPLDLWCGALDLQKVQEPQKVILTFKMALTGIGQDGGQEQYGSQIMLLGFSASPENTQEMSSGNCRAFRATWSQPVSFFTWNDPPSQTNFKCALSRKVFLAR